MLMTYGLYAGRTYEYQGFIQRASQTFYGLKESFVAQGMSPIEVTAISHDQGHFKDEVTLTLSAAIAIKDLGVFEVLFNGEEADMRLLEGNNLTVSVPYFEGNPVASITLMWYGSHLQTPFTFQLNAPKITAISPAQAAIGEEILITGHHFENFNPQYLKILFGEHEAEVIQFSRSELKIKVPHEVTAKIPQIKVISQLQEGVSDLPFMVKSPVVEQYPQQAWVNETIELTGESFHPELSRNKVYFGDLAATVISGDANTLRVKVPEGPYSGWINPINIVISEEIRSESLPFELLDHSIEILENVDARIAGYQEINNEIYVYGFDIYNASELTIQKFSETERRFYDQKVLTLPVADAKTIINTKNGYIYLLYRRTGNNFYRVDLGTGEIRQLNDAPENQTFPESEAINGDNIIFMGLAKDDYYSSPMEVYRYSVTNDSWDRMEDFTPPPVFRNFYAAKDNESYFLQGTYSSLKDVYKFNGLKYEKTSIDLPDADTRDLMLTNRYFFKDDQFYFIQDSSGGYDPNKMLIFNTLDHTWSVIEGVLPRRYPVTGIFHKGNNLYIQIIDHNYNYHMYLFDLSRIP